MGEAIATLVAEQVSVVDDIQKKVNDDSLENNSIPL
jgi:hypothetical protein